jgi:PAS domain S-box-containing protein
LWPPSWWTKSGSGAFPDNLSFSWFLFTNASPSTTIVPGSFNAGVIHLRDDFRRSVRLRSLRKTLAAELLKLAVGIEAASGKIRTYAISFMPPSLPHRTFAVAPAIRANWRRYASALAFVALAILLRSWLTPLMAQQSFVVFLVAVLASAWFGGVGPALVSLVLLHFVHGYWFDYPRGFFEPNLASIVTTTAYYLVGILVGALSQARSSAQRRAREQQQEAVSQREHLRTTLSCMADGVFVTDVHGQLTLMNPAAEALTGWRLAEAVGRPWWEVFVIRREDAQEGVESPIDRVLQQRHAVHETMPVSLTSRTGQCVPIAFSAAPVQDPDGRIKGAVLVFRDESERRRTELALRNADRRKDEFLATLAHELRNPLAPIAMGLDLLEMSINDQKAIRDVCTMMQRQTRHMVRLVDDLLDVSRITRGKLELRRTEVDLGEILRNAVEASRPLVEEAQHHLILRLPDKQIRLYADANRLTQVIVNLLNNAAKFTPRQGRIELAATGATTEVALTVSDSGIGIPADKLDRVFEMFAQINESGEYGHTGLGIGLTLVKRLVEMHGGSIEVHSAGRNLGTTFQVRLPVLPQALPTTNGTSDTRHDGVPPPKRRVLVVDDNADALESLSRLVYFMGNEVRRARDGCEAIDVAREFQPDIVLMDLGMPNMNGYDAARRLRQEPWGRDVSIIATTGWGQEEDRRRTAEAGFDRHLVKPIELAALREVLGGASSPGA